MREPVLKSVGVFVQQSNNKVFSGWKSFSFQGGLCYAAASTVSEICTYTFYSLVKVDKVNKSEVENTCS